eukprot:m.126331 g.126331  ORF g.126331 m.126331 type:complete len:652 (+) comp29197_c0_seq1:134-2089(+)
MARAMNDLVNIWLVLLGMCGGSVLSVNVLQPDVRVVDGCPTSSVTTCATITLGFDATKVIPAGANPWNASEFLSTNVTTDKTAFNLLAYYHVDSGLPRVSVKLNPQVAGSYDVKFTGPLVSGVSCSVIVTQGASGCGFIQIASNKQHFETSDGDTFFGVGENLAWVNHAVNVSTSWEPYLKNLSEHKANYIRVWLTDSWDDLFIESNGMGNYSVANTQSVETLLAAAEAADIKVLMCIESFNLFCNRPPPAPCSWEKNVYNKVNGGVLDTPDEFFTNQVAKDYFKMRLRYIVARYTQSSAVFAWEFFNEGDISTGFTPAGHALWVDEMAQYLKQVDAVRHPISTSFCCHDPTEVYSLDSVDFSMTHTYGTWNKLDLADNNQHWETLMTAQYDKPTYIAEFGNGAQSAQASEDPTGHVLHNGMWSSVVTGGAMTSMTWWWDNWVQPYNLYVHFDAIAAFTQSVQWGQYRWRPMSGDRPTCTDTPPSTTYTCAQQASWGKCNVTAFPFMAGFCCKTCSNCSGASCQAGHQGRTVAPNVRLLGSVGEQMGDIDDTSTQILAVVWIQNTNNTWSKQNATTSPRAPVNNIANLTVAFTNLAAGSYHVEWSDTMSSAQLGSGSFTCTTTRCDAAVVPDFDTDIAALISSTTVNARAP